MKKLLFTLLLISCSDKQEEEDEKPIVFGDASVGYTVSYKHRSLWSDVAADTTQMKVEILK